MNIEDLKKSGRENIIQMALDKMRGQYPNFKVEKPELVKIYASDRTVRVILGMTFKSVTVESFKSLEKVNFEVVFSAEHVTCYPCDPDELLKLDDEDRRIIDFVLKGKELSEDERITISERENHYDVSFFRGASGGAESYNVDKKTGEWKMEWHEHPMPRQMVQVTDQDGNVIEEEKFEEITE